MKSTLLRLILPIFCTFFNFSFLSLKLQKNVPLTIKIWYSLVRAVWELLFMVDFYFRKMFKAHPRENIKVSC